MLSRRVFAAAVLLTGLAAVLPARNEAWAQQEVTTPSGLRYVDVKPGNGETAKPGQTAMVHYTGWLSVAGEKGRQFDSSRTRGQPFGFPVGGGRVIKGWDEGVAGMKTGGQRTLIIPPNLAYGAQGAGGGVIPPNATLIFDVELIELK
jgi:peptidylprolyl isomerase